MLVRAQTITAATMENNLSMGPHLRGLHARKANARTGRRNGALPARLLEESTFVDRQDLAIPHDDATIDHRVTNVAAACAVDKRFHRIEERREMRLSCFNLYQVGPLADLDGTDVWLSNCARTLRRRHPQCARRGKRAGIICSGFRQSRREYFMLSKMSWLQSAAAPLVAPRRSRPLPGNP